MPNANVIFITWCFIFCMFTISGVSLTFIKRPKRWICVTIDIINGIAWTITAFGCIGILYKGLCNQTLNLTYSIMYITRILASFLIASASFDLAGKELTSIR